MNRKPFFPGFFCLFFLLFSSFQINAREKNGRFYWAFVKTDAEQRLMPVREDVIRVETAGTELEVFFQPMRNAYLYLLIFTPDAELKILFPTAPADFKQRYETFKKTIQVSDLLTTPGDYELQILVSTGRLEELEEKLLQYRSREMSSIERETYKKNLLALIQKIKRDARLPSRSQTQFYSEGGVNRMDEEELTPFISRFDFTQLYAKSYQIKNN